MDSGQEWAGRDVILLLEHGHFTILRHRDPLNLHPIQELLDKMLDPDVKLTQPGERQLLHLESILGGDPDPARPMSVAQLHALVAEQHAAPLPSPAAAAAPPRRPSLSDDMMGLD